LNWNRWVRQSHRWVSVAFMATVVVNLAVLGQEESTRMKVAYLPLLPLFLLMFSGLYLFLLPYVTKWRSGRHID
jgi:hypothetical protein